MCYHVAYRRILRSQYIYGGLMDINTDTNNSAVNWKKLYTIMLTAADGAVSSMERGDFSTAVNLLKTAMLECEDEYIDSCG